MKDKCMYIQYVNRIRRCSPKRLSLASSHATVASVDASGFLPALASKERSCTFMILVPAGHQKVIFGPLALHRKIK